MRLALVVGLLMSAWQLPAYAQGERGMPNLALSEEQIDALRELDAMMDELQKDLEDFGYRQPATEGLTQPSDAAGIERWMLNPVIANLAVRLAGDYGKTPAPNVMRQAATGRADVLIRYQKRVEVQMPSRMPVGAGNRLMGRFFRPVT